MHFSWGSMTLYLSHFRDYMMHPETHFPHCLFHLFFLLLLPRLNGCLCFLIAPFMVSACLPFFIRLLHKMRNADTNASQLCVIPFILPFCRLSFHWFFTIWVLWTIFCPFLALLLCLMVCMFLCPGGFCLLVWVPLVSVCPILGGCVCSWTLTTYWMVRVTPPARSSLPLG